MLLKFRQMSQVQTDVPHYILTNVLLAFFCLPFSSNMWCMWKLKIQLNSNPNLAWRVNWWQNFWLEEICERTKSGIWQYKYRRVGQRGDLSGMEKYFARAKDRRSEQSWPDFMAPQVRPHSTFSMYAHG